PATAKALAESFGTSAEFWMNLESAYQLAKVKADDAAVAHRARLLTLAPVKEIVKRGWIRDVADPTALKTELEKFFEVTDLSDTPDLRFAARTSIPYAELSSAHRSWLCRARKLARAVAAAPFHPETFRKRLPELHELVTSEHDIRRVPKVLADLGIK